MTSSADKINNLYLQGRYSQVISLCSELSITPESDPYSSHVLAASLFNLGRHQDANLILSHLHSTFAGSADFLSLYAANSRRIGDLDQAQVLFRDALDLEPDNRTILNNYANLLIDLDKYVEAKEILLELVEKYPDYDDANKNLNRLEKLILNLSESSDRNSKVTPPWNQSDYFEDPLLLAFNQEEIDHSYKRYISKFAPEKPPSALSSLPKLSPSVLALEQLESARRAVDEKNPALALRLCSKVISSLSSNPVIYECASDAYLQLSKFHQAEICLAHSISLGGTSLKHFFNMITFARMRKDYFLASHYYKQACNIDPSSEQVLNIKSILDQELAASNSSPIFLEEWNLPDL